MTKIQNKVMKKVYLMWFSRRVLPYFLADIVIFGVFLYLIGQYTFVRVIIDNFTRILLTTPLSIFAYVANAALNTKFVVQISFVGVLVVAILAFRRALTALVQFRVFNEETNLKRGVFY